MLNDVEPVEDHPGTGQLLANRPQVNLPHVATHDLNRAGTPGPKPLEELLHRLFITAFADPNQLPALQVVNQRQVALPLAAGHLVDPQHMQGPPHPMLQPIGNGASDRRRDRLPIDRVMGGRLLPGQMAGQPHNAYARMRSYEHPYGSPAPALA